MILVFSVFFGWLPFVYDSQVTGFWPNVKQSIMPILVLGLAGAAQLTRFVRASMLETISQDYVRTARAKGCGTIGCGASRHAKRADPGGHGAGVASAGDLRRRHHHRADLSHPWYRAP